MMCLLSAILLQSAIVETRHELQSELMWSHSSSGCVHLCLIDWTDGDISVTLRLFPHGADNAV